MHARDTVPVGAGTIKGRRSWRRYMRIEAGLGVTGRESGLTFRVTWMLLVGIYMHAIPSRSRSVGDGRVNSKWLHPLLRITLSAVAR
jgi:hypothetical protein